MHPRETFENADAGSSNHTCFAGGLHEVAIAGASGQEDGVARLLEAISGSQNLQLLDIRGIAVEDEVGSAAVLRGLSYVDNQCDLLVQRSTDSH